MISLFHLTREWPQIHFSFPLTINLYRPDPHPCPTKASTSRVTFHSHTVLPHGASQQTNKIKQAFFVAFYNILNGLHSSTFVSITDNRFFANPSMLYYDSILLSSLPCSRLYCDRVSSGNHERSPSDSWDTK